MAVTDRRTDCWQIEAVTIVEKIKYKHKPSTHVNTLKVEQ
jgi:hypothetical protein